MGTDTLIVRIAREGTGRPITYRSEFQIYRLLREEGLNVPEPILNSEETDQIEGVADAWAITQKVDGIPLKKTEWTVEAANDLARFLSVVHNLPHSGYGRLEERGDLIRGKELTPVTGIVGRRCWGAIYPFDGESLDQHTVSRVSPELITEIEAFRDEILRIGSTVDCALLHSDLHQQHVLIKDGRLSGVIDFGASFIGARAWEFATMAYYHGWENAESVIVPYASDLVERERLLLESKKLGIAIGLYKMDRAARLGQPEEKVDIAIQFVNGTLSKMSDEDVFRREV